MTEPTEPHSEPAGAGAPPPPRPLTSPYARPAPPPPEPPRLPKRPRRRGPGILGLLLGLIIIMGFGLFGLITLGGFLLGAGGGLASPGMFKGLHLTQGEIAMLKIEDAIMPGPLLDFWMDSLDDIEKSQKIRGLVLRIDSPGGSVGSSQELYDRIAKIKAGGKKVYVSMGNVAASGGYYIAAPADRIFANRGTLTGSVGVIMTTYRAEGLAEKAGVAVEVVKTGRFKDAGSMFRPMNEDERKMFEMLLNDAYEQFLDDILRGREPAIAEALAKFEEGEWQRYLFAKPENPSARKFLQEMADGRVYSGEQALQLGLVDELGSEDKTIERLAADLGVPAEASVYEPRRRLTFLDMMSSKVRETFSLPAAHGGKTLIQYRMLPY